ncbi:hypothetical protein [Modestobacter roseus]|uniref:ACT domain-containing protein n=1 Tax=Modestobacter roseus TaxID=1181884 RepID=A0A562ISP9_9ACTN|nr:hypothetical protein [Modestobacter roseus]MQA32601.1 hypothetical protein [Modestobacter roseus]TWH73755.1 hypothetical protein JD78_02279 [Modestobacter roseus]
MSLRPTPTISYRAATTDAARLRVTVTDGVALQRVLTVLTGRNHTFTRLEAEEAGGGRWTVSLDLAASPREVDLVAVRLQRLPSVLSVAVVGHAVELVTGVGQTRAG